MAKERFRNGRNGETLPEPEGREATVTRTTVRQIRGRGSGAGARRRSGAQPSRRVPCRYVATGPVPVQRRADRLPRAAPDRPARQRQHRGRHLVAHPAAPGHHDGRHARRPAAGRTGARPPLAQLRRPGRRSLRGARRHRGLRPRRLPRPCPAQRRSEEHTSELQSHHDLVCRLLLEKKKKKKKNTKIKKKKKTKQQLKKKQKKN